MKPEEAKKLPKFNPGELHPLLRDLPPYLKDPTVYNKIRRALIESLATGHSHSEMNLWAKCITCTNAMQTHKELLKKFGFKNSAQYFAWQKVQETLNKKING